MFSQCQYPTGIPVQFEGLVTSELFTHFVRKVDRKTTACNRKIALVVDNGPSHTRIEKLDNVELIFLLPNTTALTQPAGVIKNLKYFYKLELVRRRIAAVENKQVFSINLLQPFTNLGKKLPHK